ncbi:unnamed protein product [Prorocentrum cordatum]|uniref:Uncharacterized protein n=1 Tax=Prorocentrum cordatum TaxID=2364126 RepID=A0ABN9T0Q0_9DINO|nr:unnamed protein product [Polarella glacialis]
MLGDCLKSESHTDEGPPEKRQKTNTDFVKSLLFASTAGSSGDGSSTVGMARPAEAPDAPAAVEAVTKDPMKTAREIMDKASTDFEDSPKDKITLAGLVRHLSEAPISNCALSSHHRLTMLLIIEGDRWRAHSKKCFYYTGGCWDQVEAFDIQGWGYIAALEGAFTKIGGAGVDDYKCPEWKWPALQGVVGQMLRQDAVTLATLYKDAKEHSDALKKATDNKGWKGNWALRAVDTMCTFKAAMDRGATRTPLTVLFLKTCDTPKPRSQGVTFTDCYLDSNWDLASPRPENDCYMRAPYQLFWSEDETKAAGIDVAKWDEQLPVFLKGLYYKNEAVFQLELASLKLAFLRVNSANMNFKIGHGGDGKHMEATLQRNLVGEANAHYLDCGVFHDRSECDANAHMVSDIWKRFIVGEELSCRDLRRMQKDQELNYENIPVLAETGTSRNKLREQLERRIICSRMGKATFVHNEEDIPQDTLDEFLSHPWIAARFLHKYLRPFAKKCTGHDSLVMLDNIKALSTEMYKDLAWLASRLSGGVDPPPEGGQPTGAIEKNLIVSAHAGAPMQAVVKAHLVETVDCKPGTRKQRKKGASKWQNRTAAIGKSNARLFTQCDTNALRRHMVNYDKMLLAWEACGGADAFGDWEDWGNPSDNIDNASTLVAGGSVEWYAMVLEHLTTPVTRFGGVSTTKTRCVEMPSLVELQEHAKGKTDRRQAALDAFIARCPPH